MIGQKTISISTVHGFLSLSVSFGQIIVLLASVVIGQCNRTLVLDCDNPAILCDMKYRLGQERIKCILYLWNQEVSRFLSSSLPSQNLDQTLNKGFLR